MIRFNNAEFDYRPDLTLKELAKAYYAGVKEVVFEDLIIIVNGTAVPSLLADERKLQDNDSVYLVPKVEGG